MQTRDTLAVVDDKYLYNHRQRTSHSISGLVSLLEAAEELKYTHVWIVPGTEISRRCSVPGATPGWNLTNIGNDEHYSFVAARRAVKTHEDMIYLGFVEYSRWPWKPSSSTPRGLYNTVAQLEAVLGFPVEWTPAHLSMQFVKRENADHWDWLSPMTLDLEEKGFSFADDIARVLHWPPKGQEKVIPTGATHRIRMDGNSHYASAMVGLNIGEGNPEWWEGQEDYLQHTEAYDGKHPGIWKVRVYESLPGTSCIWDGQRLPSFLDREWLTTDMIEQLRRSGLRVIVDGGWYWGWKDGNWGKRKDVAYHQILRSTAEKLWSLRVFWRADSKLSVVSESVYDTISQVIKAIHGRFGRVANRDTHEKRRDIWALVVARATSLTMYRVEKIFREYGILPIAIKDDELEYAVNDPYIFDSILTLDKLGGLKLVEVVEIQK